jgi:hypothetical protein
VAKHQDLDLLGPPGPAEQDQPAERPGEHQIRESKSHATQCCRSIPLRVHQTRNPSSRPTVEFLAPTWSDEGRRFRALEREAASGPGTFHFGHLLHEDDTAYPMEIEIGILRGARCTLSAFRTGSRLGDNEPNDWIRARNGCQRRQLVQTAQPVRYPSRPTHSSAAGGSYPLAPVLTARTAESMICSSRLLWAPCQYTWPQLRQLENVW